MRAAACLPGNESASKMNNNLKPCNISLSVVSEVNSSGSHFKIRVVLEGQNRSASVAAMVDCGATALFISEGFVKEN